MRAAVLNPAGWTLGAEQPVAERENKIRPGRSLGCAWDKHRFAEEQVRGLVRQIFSPALKPAVQQVVFCAADGETDVLNLCSWLGEILVEERLVQVALMDEREIAGQWVAEDDIGHQTRSVRQFGARIHRNLWLFPPARRVAPWPSPPSSWPNLCFQSTARRASRACGRGARRSGCRRGRARSSSARRARSPTAAAPARG